MIKINRDLKINNVSIGHVATYTVTYENVYNNSVMSVDGTEYRDFVGTKRHLSIEIETIGASAVKTILDAISASRPASVYYYDVKANAYATKNFYFDDEISTNIKFWFADNTHYFDRFTINAVEVGVS